MVNATAKTNPVPSGAVQFGSDWPGLFLRGDHALKVAMSVRHLEKELAGGVTTDNWAFKCLVELASLIEKEVDSRATASE
jgi:hypothetical protein